MIRSLKVLLSIAIIPLFILCILLSFRKDEGYVIQGHIEGMAAGKAYLIYPQGNHDMTDSVNLNDGNFIFKGRVTQPLMFVLSIKESRTKLYFFVGNSAIKISTYKDSIYKAKVIGSPTEDEYLAYLHDYHEVVVSAGGYYHKLDSVNKRYNNKPDSAAKAYLKGENDKLTDYDLKVHRAFFAAHPNSVICPYIINTHFIPYFQFKQANELFALLSDKVKDSYYGRQVKESVLIEKRSGIGAKPNFTMADVNGKPVSLSSFKGKYILVDFWASWCAPCRRENPNVLANYKKYHDLGFEVLGVSLDSKKEPWLKAIETDGLSWTQVSDLKGWQNAAAEEFGVKVVPSNFLLDREGRVVAKNIREEALGQKLRAIFGK